MEIVWKGRKKIHKVGNGQEWMEKDDNRWEEIEKDEVGGKGWK